MIFPGECSEKTSPLEGLNEENTNVGDKFQIGEAIVMVTQPRSPCYKLAVKFQRDDIWKRMLANGRSGFYFSGVSSRASSKRETRSRKSTKT